jgi:hypothetical protein
MRRIRRGLLAAAVAVPLLGTVAATAIEYGLVAQPAAHAAAAARPDWTGSPFGIQGSG